MHILNSDMYFPCHYQQKNQPAILNLRWHVMRYSWTWKIIKFSLFKLFFTPFFQCYSLTLCTKHTYDTQTFVKSKQIPFFFFLLFIQTYMRLLFFSIYYLKSESESFFLYAFKQINSFTNFFWSFFFWIFCLL